MQTFLIIIASVVVLILPGFTLYSWLNLQRDDFAENAAICLGLSISLTSLLYYLTFYLPFKITPLFLLIFYSACAVLSAFDVIRKKNKITWSPEITITLVLFLSVLLLRLFQIRELVLPAWVDSVHHALITRVILENGSIPATLEPYLPVPFSYYFGFHSLAAVVSNLSGQSVEKVILVLGQVLNACMPLAIYRLGRALWDDRTKPLIAALLVAFVSQMPAYYVTWGRYTLLTGLILLALAMAEVLDVRRVRNGFQAGFALFLLVIGMTISHYFVSVLFLVFGSLQLIVSFIRSGYRLSLADRSLSIATLLAFTLLAPWLIRAWMNLGYTFNPGVILPAGDTGWRSVEDTARYLLVLAGPARSSVFLLIGALGIIQAIRVRQSQVLAIWTLLLLIAAFPLGLKLPNIRPDHIVIILFLPFSLWASLLLVHTGTQLWHRIENPRWRNLLISIPVLALSVWGVIETRSIINSETVLATQSDVTAIEWISDHVDADARFLINSTSWQNTLFRGVDGGFWILPLTGRFTIPPPVIFSWGDRDATRTINSMAGELSRLRSCEPAFWQIIRDGAITHIYIRNGVGSIQAVSLNTCPGLDRIYHEEGVSIYSINEN